MVIITIPVQQEDGTTVKTKRRWKMGIAGICDVQGILMPVHVGAREKQDGLTPLEHHAMGSGRVTAEELVLCKGDENALRALLKAKQIKPPPPTCSILFQASVSPSGTPACIAHSEAAVTPASDPLSR